MAQWMLVSHDWLKIVVSVVLRDLWITSYAHIKYITDIGRSTNISFVCQLAGITDLHQHLAKTCRSLTISVYQTREGEYASQCADLVEFATTDPDRNILLPGIDRKPIYAFPCHSIATLIRDWIPGITSLHFVLLDCTATYRAWDTDTTADLSDMATSLYPHSLTELHFTFAYTCAPPALLRDAPRGTFFPPPGQVEMPLCCRFHGVRRLVVRDANADFVAFLTTACPQLERVESTAEFRAEDVPPCVPADVKARLEFVRLPSTAAWGLAGSDVIPRSNRRLLTFVELRDAHRKRMRELDSGPAPPPSTEPSIAHDPARMKRGSVWRLLKRVFRDRK